MSNISYPNQTAKCKLMARRAALSLALGFFACFSQTAAYAGFGNMFGSKDDSSSSSSSSSSSASSDPSAPYNANPGGDFMPPGTPGAGLGDPSPPKSLFGNGKKKSDKDSDPKLPQNGDFTEDEKRVQHKWQDRIANDHRLISTGERMMHGAKNNPKDKNYQKGKVMKSIGEKDLADLKQNSPFPTPSLDERKKPDSL